MQSADPLDQFEYFCSLLTLEDGTEFVLQPFQRKMLEEFFGGADETLVLIPKKNGKSTLLAALALFHVCTTPDAECVIVAASRDQAEIMLRQAQGFVRRSDGLSERITTKQRRLDHRSGGRIRVLASDVDTADGVIPTLVLVDELHRHRNADLYGVLRDGLGPRHGQLVTISTAGFDQDSPLGRIRRKAYEMPTFERTKAECRNFARSADGEFVMHEWAIEPDDDPLDIDLVAKANPAPWQTVEELRKRHDSPSTTPWQWLRFACGVWTEGEEPWIDPAKWDACKGPPGLPEGHGYLGVDLGIKHDSTAIVTVVPAGDKLHVQAEIMSPRAGGAVSFDDVENRIRTHCAERQIAAVVCDPWSLIRTMEMLDGEGIRMESHPMSHERMGQTSATMYRLIDEGRIAHDGDPTLRAHVMGGVKKETERGWRLAKDPKVKRPIDALIAMAIACSVAEDDLGSEMIPIEVFG